MRIDGVQVYPYFTNHASVDNRSFRNLETVSITVDRATDALYLIFITQLFWTLFNRCDQMNNTSTVLTNILQPDEILHKNSQYNTGDLDKENGSLPLVTNDHNKEDCMQVDEVNK
jgi:hypothetical protein